MGTSQLEGLTSIQFFETVTEDASELSISEGILPNEAQWLDHFTDDVWIGRIWLEDRETITLPNDATSIQVGAEGCASSALISTADLEEPVQLGECGSIGIRLSNDSSDVDGILTLRLYKRVHTRHRTHSSPTGNRHSPNHLEWSSPRTHHPRNLDQTNT